MTFRALDLDNMESMFSSICLHPCSWRHYNVSICNVPCFLPTLVLGEAEALSTDAELCIRGCCYDTKVFCGIVAVFSAMVWPLCMNVKLEMQVLKR